MPDTQKRSGSKLVSFLLCAVTSAGVCSAQQANQPFSPSEIVERFLKAQQAEQWSEAASYLDLDAVERIRRREVENYSSMTRYPWTVEKLMKDDPSMPRAVAEYQIQRMERLAKEFDIRKPWSFEFSDVETLSALKHLSREPLAVSWVKAHDLSYRARHNAAAC